MECIIRTYTYMSQAVTGNSLLSASWNEDLWSLPMW